MNTDDTIILMQYLGPHWNSHKLNIVLLIHKDYTKLD